MYPLNINLYIFWYIFNEKIAIMCITKTKTYYIPKACDSKLPHYKQPLLSANLFILKISRSSLKEVIIKGKWVSLRSIYLFKSEGVRCGSCMLKQRSDIILQLLFFNWSSINLAALVSYLHIGKWTEETESTNNTH